MPINIPTTTSLYISHPPCFVPLTYGLYPGVVPIVLYCNRIAKYCNTLVVQNPKALQYLLQKFPSIAKSQKYCKNYCKKYCKKHCKITKVLQNFKVLQKVSLYFVQRKFSKLCYSLLNFDW